MAINGILWTSNSHRRFEFWTLLRSLVIVLDVPWLAAGAFDEILWSHEKHGDLPRRRSLMQAFQDVLEHLQETPFYWIVQFRKILGHFLVRQPLHQTFQNGEE